MLEQLHHHRHKRQELILEKVQVIGGLAFSYELPPLIYR
jgi:hypothetical protein